MKNRILVVSFIFVVGALYMKQWHMLMPQLKDTVFLDHVQHPVIVLAFLGYLFCKTEKQKWQYSLFVVVIDVLLVGCKLFIFHTAFIVLDMLLLPMCMYIFYKFYFDWQISIELSFVELKQKIESSTIIDEQLAQRYQTFLDFREEHVNQFNMRCFLYQEKEILDMLEKF